MSCCQENLDSSFVWYYPNSQIDYDNFKKNNQKKLMLRLNEKLQEIQLRSYHQNEVYKQVNTPVFRQSKRTYLTLTLRPQNSLIELAECIVLLPNTLIQEHRSLPTLLILLQQRLLPLPQPKRSTNSITNQKKYIYDIQFITQ
jgi:hypothetical protein